MCRKSKPPQIESKAKKVASFTHGLVLIEINSFLLSIHNTSGQTIGLHEINKNIKNDMK